MRVRRITAFFLTFALASGTGYAATALEEARQLGQQGHWQESLDPLNSYLKKNPGDVEALFLKGVAASKSGYTSQAIASFEELTRRRPDLPEPFNNLAVLYAKAGEYEKAQKALEQAIATHPSYATAHNNLSELYKKMAAIAYNRALNLKANGGSQSETQLALIDSLHPVATAPTLAGVEKVAVTPPAASSPPPSPPAAVKPVTGTVSLHLEAKAKKADIKEVAASILDWARAWGAKDVAAYLAHYSPEFTPADVRSRAEWEQQRQERLTQPRFIKVQIDRLKVEVLDDQTANALFRQRYRSDRVSDTVRKQLRLKKEDGHWLIIDESIAQ